MHSFERKLSPLSNGVSGKVVQRIGRELFDLKARGDIFFESPCKNTPVGRGLTCKCPRASSWWRQHGIAWLVGTRLHRPLLGGAAGEDSSLGSAAGVDRSRAAVWTDLTTIGGRQTGDIGHWQQPVVARPTAVPVSAARRVAMSQPSDCRDPADSGLSSAAAPVEAMSDPTAASPETTAGDSSAGAASPIAGQEPATAAEAPAEVPAVQETGEIVQEGAAQEVAAQELSAQGAVEEVAQEGAAEVEVQQELPTQEAVEEVAQEVAAVVAQEEATPMGSGPDQQSELEPADDMLEPVDELPLDEELMDMLPTVVEDPENEAKEQKALLEESVVEVVEGQPPGAKNEPQQQQSEEVGSSTADNSESARSSAVPEQENDTLKDVPTTKSVQHEADLKQTEQVEEVAITAEVTNTAGTCVVNAEQGAEEPAATGPITTATDAAATAESTQSAEEAEEHAKLDDTAVELSDIKPSASVGRGAETTDQPVAHSEEGEQQQAGEPTQLGGSQQEAVPSDGSVQTSIPTTEPESSTKETGDENKNENKKRKKSKEHRKKKSVEGKDYPRDKNSSKRE